VQQVDERGREGSLHVHNVFVEALTTSGIVGFVPFILAILTTLTGSVARLRTAQQEDRVWLLMGALGVLGALTDLLSLNGLISPWIWVAIGLNEAVVGRIVGPRGTGV
jgi:O-antigen ligase